jgi:putative ABC transport system permease protein
MEHLELFYSALRSLRTNLVRTLLTMLGIIIGISSVILIASLGESSIQFITNQLSQFGTNYFQVTAGSDMMASLGGGSGKPLTLDDSTVIKNSGIANIENVAPIGFGSRVLSANDINKTVMVYGLTPEAQIMMKPEIIYGEDISEEDKNSKIIVLGANVSDDLFGKETDPVGESVNIEDTKYRVIGVTKSSGGLVGSFFDSAVMVPLEVLNNQILGSDDIWEIDISVYNPDILNETMDDVKNLLRDTRGIKEGADDDFTMMSFKESLNIVQTVTGLLTMLIAGVSAISLVVGGVGIMNIMLVSVTERTKEIGLLKSIGAKEHDILIEFLVESVVITVLGGAIGIIIGVGTSVLISLVANLPIIISIPWIIIALVVSIFVGVVFGLYPARRAAKMSPIDALRNE